MSVVYDKNYFLSRIYQKLAIEPNTSANSATEGEIYLAAAEVVREIMADKRKHFLARINAAGQKQVYYLSMEFLMGRSLRNSLFNLGLVEPMAEAVEALGVKLENLYNYEPDPGLGNGGLGRLAACYLDGLSTRGDAAMGYSILYEYGIFQQKIIDGWQTECPDYWLPGGEVWLEAVPEHTVEVRFGGQIQERWDGGIHLVEHTGYTTVLAVPHNMYVAGYGSDGVNVLRLWRAKSPGFDMERFNKGDYMGAVGQSSMGEAISKVLYPNDNHLEGKSLRLRQQYFLVAASVGDIVRRHMVLYDSLDNFAEKNAIHINDTHPTLAIPELMRLLLDDCGYGWDDAWGIVTRTFAYTNHTVMSEALEVWNEELLKGLLPRIYQIICEINRRFCLELQDRYHLDQNTISRMSIVQNHSIHMAKLAVCASHSINGVSALHSEIIKNTLFRDFYRITPYKFRNVTNGIASRRWLCQANPALTKFIESRIGPGFKKDLSQLKKLLPYADDPDALRELAEVKRQNKERFAAFMKKERGIEIDPDSIFDVQVKRLHEYKRQQLNGLDILATYLELRDNPNLDLVPRTYIFGAKAAPGYFLAKQIIKFLCSLGDRINNDPLVAGRMKVVYVEEYNVSMSELLMPAADISEQISLAGTEASGTGNMKLMLSGAVTLGTMDGANVEICKAAGEENELIFGMTTPQVEERKKSYNPHAYYENNPTIRRCLDFLLHEPGFGPFPELCNSLRNSDPYMTLADFDAYRAARRRSQELYRDQQVWQAMSLRNIATSGIFCADRAVEEYARNIWGLR